MNMTKKMGFSSDEFGQEAHGYRRALNDVDEPSVALGLLSGLYDLLASSDALEALEAATDLADRLRSVADQLMESVTAPETVTVEVALAGEVVGALVVVANDPAPLPVEEPPRHVTDSDPDTEDDEEEEPDEAVSEEEAAEFRASCAHGKPLKRNGEPNCNDCWHAMHGGYSVEPTAAEVNDAVQDFFKHGGD